MAYSRVFYPAKLFEKRILIFGSTSDVGRAVMEASLQHGANVIISSLSRPRLVRTLAHMEITYPALKENQLRVCECDLSDRDDLEADLHAFFTDVVAEVGKLDHVVFAAADVRQFGPLSALTIQSAQRDNFIRTMAPVAIAKLLGEFMNPGPESSFTLTGESLTSRPLKGFGLWSATGLDGLCRGLAVELAPLRVNLVSLGIVMTKRMKKEGSEDKLEALATGTLVGRLGRPWDVAEAYLYCMRDEYVTGSVIETNGGRLLY